MVQHKGKLTRPLKRPRSRTLPTGVPAPFDAWPPGDGEADKWAQLIQVRHPYSPDQLNAIARALAPSAGVDHVAGVAEAAKWYLGNLESGLDSSPRDLHRRQRRCH